MTLTTSSPVVEGPLIRILMGTRNGAPWLEEQLDSFLAQRHSNWTLWVSDDGSTDETVEVLRHFASRHPGRVERILHGPGQGSAANYLHLLCHPDLPPGMVALSDQDDVWLPGKLAGAVDRLRQAGDAPAAWAARYLITDADLRPIGASQHWPRPPSFGNAVVQNILSGHTLTLNAAALSLLRRAGRLAVAHHDWWIYLALAATGAKLVVDSEVVLKYRQHSDNAVGIRSRRGARRLRARGMLDGTYGGWVAANLRALALANLPLTPPAQALVRRWSDADRLGRLRLIREFGLHRQSRRETGLIQLAVALGRL